MIKAIVFDLDGVLVDSKDIHYQSLNMALSDIDNKYVIDREEHLARYDGRPTKVKLKMLSETKALPESLHNKVWADKQKYTVELIEKMEKNERLVEMISTLKQKGYKLACASNSIKETIHIILRKLGIESLFDLILSHEDCKKPKPAPEIYLRCALEFGFSVKEIVVCEDSHIGRKAALDSGCHLCPVEEPSECTLEHVLSYVNYFNKLQPIPIPWILTPDINVVIPMAGLGSRFVNEGYKQIKPLIPVFGRPMIKFVVDNLNILGRYIFICQKKHVEEYRLDLVLPLLYDNSLVSTVEGLTEGAACTVLSCEQYIDNDKPLLIANSDQYVDWNVHEFMYKSLSEGIDGAILTFKSDGDKKWSYARTDEKGYVVEVKEKEVISDRATVGIYFFRQGKDFVKYAKQMIEKNIRVNGEFYVAPIYNELIADGKKIITFDCEKMLGLGIPSDLRIFLKEKEGCFSK